MIIINPPEPVSPSWEERLADPLVMLRSELDELRQHILVQAHRLHPPMLPRGPRGKPQQYRDASILLMALVQTV